MACGPSPKRSSNVKPSGAQESFLCRLRRAVADLGKPPEGLSGQEALGALLSRQGYAGESAALAPLDVDLLSLPPPGHTTRSLEELLGQDGAELSKALIGKLLPKEMAAENIQTCKAKKPYCDPRLRDRRRYLALVERLLGCGLVRFVRKPRCEVGVFAVWKKHQRQRLILDARWSNEWFKGAADVRLATGSGLGAIEVDGGSPVFLGQVDIYLTLSSTSAYQRSSRTCFASLTSSREGSG